MTYTYVPLDLTQHQFRLLLISPRTSSAAGQPEFQLRTFSLDNHGDYETISYCWGDPTPCCTVLIDGKELRLARSSATILDRLSTSSSQSRLIWIDSICVNQSDIRERAHQVPLMARIYPQAVGNIIYLGEGDALTSKAFKNIREIGEEVIQMDWTQPPKELKTPVDKNAISAFLLLPWFNRVWVVQEAVLARKSICILGGDELDFVVVGLVIVCLLVNFSVISFASKFDGIPGGVAVIGMLQSRQRRADGESVDFNNCLLDTLTAQCTEARDKIFGVLGLYKPSTGPSSLLSVDYNKSYQAVYRDATRHALETTRFDRAKTETIHTSIIRFITHSNVTDIEDPDLPSWVPRYHEKQDFERKGHALVVFHIGTFPEGETLVRDQLGDPNVLELRGRVLDTVVKVSPVFEPDMFSDDLTQLRELLAMIQVMVQKSGTRNGLDELGRVLIADTNHRTKPSTLEDWIGFQSMLECMEKTPSRLASSLSDDPGTTTSGETPDADDSDLRYYRVLVQACRGRSFIVTKRGEIGLAPKICQVGDTVVAILVDSGGGPYFMRPNEVGDHSFKLIGHGYLHGYMPGRETEAAKKHDAPYEWIKIT